MRRDRDAIRRSCRLTVDRITTPRVSALDQIAGGFPPSFVVCKPDLEKALSGGTEPARSWVFDT
jgi:hypothetical protein